MLLKSGRWPERSECHLPRVVMPAETPGSAERSEERAMPDLTFFPDPQVDRVLGVLVELAGEVYVLRQRLNTVETLLEQRGCVSRADLENYVPSAEERAARLAERDAFIRRILAPMTHEADSPAPEFQPA